MGFAPYPRKSLTTRWNKTLPKSFFSYVTVL